MSPPAYKTAGTARATRAHVIAGEVEEYEDRRRGAVLGGYQLIEPLGEGEAARTWGARRVVTGESVALRFLDDIGINRWEDLLHGIAGARALPHPAVVAAHDVFPLDSGTFVIVTERLVGESLASRLQRTTALPLTTAATLFLPVVSALRLAHRQGVIHLGLRPEAIFLMGPPHRERVRVLDFGLAPTEVGRVTATPIESAWYLAPEQLCGGNVDHRADIWSLALILYQVLSGILPSRANMVGKLLERLLLRPIWPLAQAAPDLPPDITELVDRMLSVRIERRPDLSAVERVLSQHARWQPS